jgi:hypothetical protein
MLVMDFKITNAVAKKHFVFYHFLLQIQIQKYFIQKGQGYI